MKFCSKCGTQLSENSRFCMNCGSPVSAGIPRQPQYQNPQYQQYQNPQYQQYQNPQPQQYRQPQQASAQSFFDWLTGKVNHFAGGEGAVRPPDRDLFSETFKKHTQEEAEEIFACGTLKTTPRLDSESTVWPKPWLYGRILVAFALAFVMLHICIYSFGNGISFPGVIMLGSFMVPMSVMVFFFELNTPKNISFYTVMKVFLVGGCASLLFSIFLFEIFPVDQLDYSGAIMVGIIEEIGKLGIVAFFLSKEKNARYHINGLLIGAAVGAGFAAFESAGYAFSQLNAFGYDAMLDNIFLRAVLAPGGHVVWAAMSGYAIMLVRKYAGPSATGFLSQSRFWQIFWMPVAMHAVWDMPISIGAEYCLVQILLVVLSWVVIFVFINNSLSQLGRVLRKETVIQMPV